MAGALNPVQLIAMLRQGNPQQVAEQLIQQNYPNNPQMQQLVQMAQRGDTQGLQQIAQQICSQQGRDFNTEMNRLISMTKGL